jgi:hypothetical protein
MKQNRYIIMLTKYILKTVKKKKGKNVKKNPGICLKFVRNMFLIFGNLFEFGLILFILSKIRHSKKIQNF